MAVNIFRYLRFSASLRAHGDWKREGQILCIPIALLILFLAGYLAIGIFGKPDLVIASVLFGGSIFVFVMLLLMQRALERIRENERLEAKLAAAEETSRAKTAFLSNMSHDIRTPLNAIIGYTTLANGDNVTLPEKTAYLSKIETAGRQLLEIVNDVLEMGRIESGKLELSAARVNLEACVLETADLVRTQMEQKQIGFSVEVSAADKWVLCDRTHLSRALMNLLGNAAKFTPEHGTVCLSLEELQADGETGTYEIRVRDTGIGMSQEFVQNIFKPFERERSSTVSKIQGTGLGMAITKSIIDFMGGTIDVTTEKNAGTVFVITLSLPIVEPAPEAVPVTKGCGCFDGCRALLAEDNPINREIAQLLLTQAGFQIECAENGQVAVDMVASSAAGYYNLILMDIQMPVMDGYTAAKAIRALPDQCLSGIPIVAMTANAFLDDVRAAEEAGMNGHITKPLDVNQMMTTLNSVLKRT